MGLVEDHPVKLAVGGCCSCLSIPAIIMIVQQNTVGLVYSAVSKSIDPTPVGPGLHFIGLAHSFISFPTTLQTMRYSTADHDLLHTRTSDGLPLILGVTFQYKYNTTQIYEMYQAYLTAHRDVLFLAAHNLINEIGTHFAAAEYFDNKRHIAYVMNEELDAHFRQNFFCSVESLQIRIFELPTQFDSALQTTITTKQNITATKKYVDNVLVSLATNEIIARKDANVTVALAGGNATATIVAANATATVAALQATAQGTAYADIRSKLGLQKTTGSDELLEYIWNDNLASGTSPASTQVLVGVDPGTYINGKV